MAGKKYTVIIIPDKSSGTRRFGIASRTVWVAAICVLSLIAVSIFLVKDRVSLERKILRLQRKYKIYYTAVYYWYIWEIERRHS